MYDRLEPIGEDRGDFRMASLSATIVNIVRKLYGKTGVEMVSPSVFMPEWDRDFDEEETQVPKQSVEQMKKILETIADVQNRRIKKEKRLHNNPPRKFVQKKTKVNLK